MATSLPNFNDQFSALDQLDTYNDFSNGSMVPSILDQPGMENAMSYPVSIPSVQVNPNNGAIISSSANGTDVAGIAADAATPSTGAVPANYAALGQAAGTSLTVPPSGGILGQLETWLAASTSNIVAVLIGLILIAGAIFSFSSVKDTAVSAARAIAA